MRSKVANYWASQDGSFGAVTTNLHILGGALFFVVGPVLELTTILLGESLDDKLGPPPELCHEGEDRHPNLLCLTHTTSRNDAYNLIRKSLLRCTSLP